MSFQTNAVRGTPALFGIVNFAALLSCADDALGQPIDVSVGGIRGTLTLPSLPDWTGDYLHKPLMGPIPAQIWRRGKKLIDWGAPFSFRTGKGATVRHALIEFQVQPHDMEAAAEQINNRFQRWFHLFEQYVTLFTPQNTSRVRTIGEGTGPIELLIHDGDELRHVARNKPIMIEVYMSQADETLHLNKLREACRLCSLGLSPRLEYQLMVEAYSAQRDGDYRKAVIEAATALEVSLTARALEEFKKQNISFGKGLLKKFRTLNGRFELVRLLSIPLPDKDYVKLIINPRNDVIHQADFPGEDLADQIISEVNQLLRLLSPQLHQGEDEGEDGAPTESKSPRV